MAGTPMGPNIAPNMPLTLPQTPNVNPGAPMMTPAQVAGGVPLGCGACGQTSLGQTYSKIPMWAKIAIPVTIIGITIGIAVAVSRRPKVPLYEEIDEEEIDF